MSSEPITLETSWLLKRLAISAGYFFGTSGRQRSLMRNELRLVRKSVTTAEAMRLALRIQPRAWAACMDEFYKKQGVIRKFNGRAGYSSCLIGDRDNAAFASYPLPGDAGKQTLSELTEKLKKFEGGKTDGATELDRDSDDGVPVPADATDFDDEDAKDEEGGSDASAEEVAELKAQIAKLEEAAAKKSEGKVLTIEIKEQGKADRRVERAHKTMPDLLIQVQCGNNVYLVGPAGSGKTTGAEQVAAALSLAFGFMSVGPQTTKSDVFGYMSASGTYVPTEFRNRYENGGVFLFDEIDAAHPGVLTQVNAALAGSACAFPDRMVKRHETFRCVAAGNTYGTGPDRVYVGRNELDGASLDRFAFLEWSYDEALEMEIATAFAASDKQALARGWVGRVHAVRAAVQKLGMRHIVSPRASIAGVRLLSAGVKQPKVEETVLWKAMKPDEVKRVLANV